MKKFILTILFASAVWSTPASAQSIIRDAEIEETLRLYASPIFEAAGIGARDVNIIIVDNPALNAFVAGGMNLFLHTGLIVRTDTPDQLIGVIAHETGHIAGGHLIRTREALENASYQTILATVLGIAGAVVGGAPDVAGAVMAGGQSTALRGFLSHSRAQEASADQAAVSYLEQAGLSTKGLVSFLEKLEGEELLPASQQTEYVRTHPLTQNRVDYLDQKVKSNAAYDRALPAAWVERHARMKAKIQAFKNPTLALSLYKKEDRSVTARYARAIAYYRKNEMDQALTILEKLLKEEPDNAYFYELKGQILFENARVKESLIPYKQAITLQPDSGLLRRAYAHALIESYGKDPAHLEDSIQHLNFALKTERRSSYTHRLLATAHGRLGHIGLTHLHLAEEAALQNNKDNARHQLDLALENLEKGTPGWLRAQDLQQVLDKKS